MRIVFVLPEINLAGGTKIVLEYADYLACRGHDVTCVIPTPRPPALRERLRTWLKQGRRLPTTPEASHLWAKSLRVISGTSVGHLTPAEIPAADVVIATWWETAQWLEPLGPDHGRKVHFVQDHEVFEGLPLDAVRSVYRLDIHKIVVSRWLEEVMRETYAAQSIAFVPNGIDLHRFDTAPLDSRTSDIGFVWSTTPRKNAGMAVDVIKRLKQQRPSLTARVFSAEVRPPELAGLDWVTFHECPDQAAIPGLYADCRAWLFPSLTEGYGLPLLEAMASGTPVIATRAGAAPDLIADGNGVLVDWTPEAMAAATGGVLDMSGELWGSMSAAARATAERFDWTTSARAFEDDLKRVSGCV